MQARIIFGRKFLCQASYPHSLVLSLPPSLRSLPPALDQAISSVIYSCTQPPYWGGHGMTQLLASSLALIAWVSNTSSCYFGFCLGWEDWENSSPAFWLSKLLIRFGFLSSFMNSFCAASWGGLHVWKILLFFPEGAHLGHTEGPNAIAALVTFIAILPVRIPPTKKSSFPLLFLKEKNKHVE